MLADEWRSFREKVVPRNASTVQIQECRRAFYAGAQAMLWMLERSPNEEKEAFEFYDQLDSELNTFKQDVLRGIK